MVGTSAAGCSRRPQVVHTTYHIASQLDSRPLAYAAGVCSLLQDCRTERQRREGLRRADNNWTAGAMNPNSRASDLRTPSRVWEWGCRMWYVGGRRGTHMRFNSGLGFKVLSFKTTWLLTPDSS
jgi:hypothetical protein